MAAYESGGHMYHATMPTDALTAFRDVQRETAAYGFEKVREEQLDRRSLERANSRLAASAKRRRGEEGGARQPLGPQRGPQPVGKPVRAA